MNHLVDTYGYWAVALFVAAESLGIPVPGETVLIVAGTYAGHSRSLSPWIIFVVAAASAVAGDNIGYALGKFGGYRLVRRYGAKFRVDESKLRISRYLFDTYGTKVVFFGRFVSILRTYAAFLAGASRMNWPRFSIANATGGILWAAIFTYVSYVAGDTLRRASGIISWAVGGVAAAIVVVTVIVVRRRIEDFAARADAAYPDSEE
jgi:membrane protein DedA with SNARE-associated domain